MILRSTDSFTILVVEDEPDLLSALSEVIESFGYTVIGASHASDGLELLKSKKIDVVLSDINMPGMSGLQLLAKARKQYLLAPFIFITGNSSLDYVLEAVRLGAFDFVIKPFDFEALDSILKRVTSIVQRQDYIEELLASIGTDVAPQTYAEIKNLRRQMNLLRVLGTED